MLAECTPRDGLLQVLEALLLLRSDGGAQLALLDAVLLAKALQVNS